MNIIRKIIKEQLLSERAGISEIVRRWASVLKNEVDREVKSHREKQYQTTDKPEDDPFYWRDETSRGGYYGGQSYRPMSYDPLNEVVVYGEDFPELYDEFSVDYWVLTNSNRIEYDHYESGYDEEGNYIVYLNIPLSSMGMSAFIHEIKHAYDDWNRMRSGGKPIRDSWEIKNIYTKDFEKLILGGSGSFPQLGPIVRNYYMGSKLETPAYLENEYDGVDYLNTARKLMNFKASTYLNKEGQPAKGLENEFVKLQQYDIPFFKKFKTVMDFLNYTEKYFNKRGTDIFKRINKMRAVHGLKRKDIEPIQKWEPKTTGTKVEKEEDWDDWEEGTEIGGWKYSKDKGWYKVGDDDFGY